MTKGQIDRLRRVMTRAAKKNRAVSDALATALTKGDAGLCAAVEAALNVLDDATLDITVCDPPAPARHAVKSGGAASPPKRPAPPANQSKKAA